MNTLLDPALALAADIVEDLERSRIANENRLRQLTRTGPDEDGLHRGFGLDKGHPDVVALTAMVDSLRALEHEGVLNLQRKMRKHGLGAWVKQAKGVGEKQAARLLAVIGDPYINAQKGAPRTVSALWAYCGLHVVPGNQEHDDTQLPSDGDQGSDSDQPSRDTQKGAVGVAPRRRRGERANWSTKAKTRAYLVAQSCLKQLGPNCKTTRDEENPRVVHVKDNCSCSPYRVKYDQRRAHTDVARPDWTDGHSHNDGLRVMAKEVLKDLWIAAKTWHDAQDEDDESVNA